jgi:hypothetical protein
MAALLEKTQETGAEFFAGNHGLFSLPLYLLGNGFGEDFKY